MSHLALVTTSFPYGVGGSEAAGSFVVDLAEALAQSCRVTVIAPGLESGQSNDNGIRVQRFKVPALPLSLLRALNPLDWRRIFLVIRSGARAVRDVSQKDRFDHMLALWALPSGYWARCAARAQSIPFTVWGLGSDIWSLGRIPIVRGILRKVLAESHCCFADGYELVQQMERIAGRRCEFLASARRLPKVTSRIASRSAPYTMAFLGRWHVNKGVDLLLEALKKLDDSCWTQIQEIRICGGGPMEQLVAREIELLRKLGRPVFQFGFLDKREAAELFQWADFVLLPSRIESIPVVFSDAVHSMRPLISTPVGDLPELMERYRLGVLAQNVTAIAYAQAIAKAVTVGPAVFAERMGEAARVFDIDKIASDLARRLSLRSEPVRHASL